MTEIKKDDIVRVRKRQRKWCDQHPLYTSDMLEFSDKEYTVHHAYSASDIRLKDLHISNKTDISQYVWREEWLELVISTEQVIQFTDEDFKV